MKIGICDDDAIMVEHIKQLVSQYFARKQITIDLYLYYTGREVIEAEQELDLIFLDIEMPEVDGMNVARFFYKKSKASESTKTKIVFLTGHDESVRKAFQVNAFRFLLKDTYESEMEECLDAFCEEILMNVVYQLEKNGVCIHVKQHDILFIRTAHNGSEIWVRNDIYNSGLSLNKWMDLLDQKIFVRAHKNSIVNLAHINYIDDYIYMYTGEKVEYSRRNSKELQKKFYQYIYDNAR